MLLCAELRRTPLVQVFGIVYFVLMEAPTLHLPFTSCVLTAGPVQELKRLNHHADLHTHLVNFTLPEAIKKKNKTQT